MVFCSKKGTPVNSICILEHILRNPISLSIVFIFVLCNGLTFFVFLQDTYFKKAFLALHFICGSFFSLGWRFIIQFILNVPDGQMKEYTSKMF